MDPPRPFSAVLLLAGGESRRMGAPKAWLDWHGAPLLVHLARALGGLAGGRVIVAADAGRALPEGAWERVDDAAPGQGPLAGLATGLARAGSGRVAVAACDYPFASASLFEALARAAPAAPVALPRHDGRVHPLLAVWSASLAEACAESLARDARRVMGVVDAAGGTALEAAGLGLADPARILANVNDPDDLARARSASARGGSA